MPAVLQLPPLSLLLPSLLQLVLHTWMAIISLRLDSGMSIGSSTVRSASGSAWNWLSVVLLPSWRPLLTTLKLLVRFWMNVVFPRPLSPAAECRHKHDCFLFST